MRTTSGGVAYDDLGRGEPAILCMPGWCIRRSLFSELIPRLAQRTRVLALDWRGHGDSAAAAADLREEDLVTDALAVIEDSGTHQVALLAQAHAGWIAIELMRRLGARVPAMVFTSWAMGMPPPPLRGAIQALQDEARWEAAREQLVSAWTGGAGDELKATIAGSIELDRPELWSAAARAIGEAYLREQSPLTALSRLTAPPRALHVYSQPVDPEYLTMQQEFASAHAWFEVRRLDGSTHFPMLERPSELAREILGLL